LCQTAIEINTPGKVPTGASTRACRAAPAVPPGGSIGEWIQPVKSTPQYRKKKKRNLPPEQDQMFLGRTPLPKSLKKAPSCPAVQIMGTVERSKSTGDSCAGGVVGHALSFPKKNGKRGKQPPLEAQSQGSTEVENNWWTRRPLR